MVREGKDLVAQVDEAQALRTTFDAFVEDLITGLARRGIRLVPAPNRPILQNGREVGRVVLWEPPRKIVLAWRSADWTSESPTTVEMGFRRISGRTRISVAYPGWESRLGNAAPDLPGWFAQQVAAPLLDATGSRGLGDWITDRRARRPSGAAARDTYRNPRYHRPNFRLLLKTLAIRPEDYLLEVGCGGGAFLHEALESGCRAAALDHSPEMVRLAREVNRESIARGRLEVVVADAASIPYASGRFSCTVTTGMIGFIPDPVAALSEVRRTLSPHGRFALFTSTRELAGTPAAPEPVASRIRFYEDAELRRLALDAGLADVAVQHPDLEPFAREAGLSEDDIAFFRDTGGAQLLTARRA